MLPSCGGTLAANGLDDWRGDGCDPLSHLLIDLGETYMSISGNME